MNQISNSNRKNLKLLFDAISTSEYYKEFDKKVLFIQGVGETSLYPLHHSIVLTNENTFTDYYNRVKNFVNDNWKGDVGYSTYVHDEFIVTISNVEKLKYKTVKQVGRNNFVIVSKRSYSTFIEKNNNIKTITDPAPVFNETEVKDPKKESRFIIKPSFKDNNCDKLFCAMDIETIIMDNLTNEHIPVAITTYSNEFNKIFLIDHKMLMEDSDKAVQKLFKEYIKFMKSLKKDYTIFVHNLGSYDGYFLYKNLVHILGVKALLNPLIDNSNKFISINYEYFFYLTEEEAVSKGMTENDIRKPNGIKLIWKDSMRIFPGSLNDLCKQFGVEGKISSYNTNFNNIELFDKPELLKNFKEYSIQDSIALYKAMKNARELYFKNYKIDLTTIFSTASLAFKIFKIHFLKFNIPLLSAFQDNYVREAYIGGATDYYISKGEKIYWYDINSLYPYAMLEPVPYKMIRKHPDLSKVLVKNFKGFVKARIICPLDIKNPIVAFKYEGKTIYPRGEWIGTYFEDYLAKAETYGYKIELISGIEFEYKNIFKDYINHFYEIKKTSKGSLRYLAKLKLNSLYGMFGRKQESNYILNIPTEDVHQLFGVYIIKNVIDLGNGYSTVVAEKHSNSDLLSELNTVLKQDFKNFDLTTNSNVAIASAITSRAQMIMMDYKNHPDFEVYYTDTDSVYTDKPIPSYLVGDDLGQMKNETLDKFGVEYIDKAIFVGLKKYGLQVTDLNGVKHELSTFAGVPKNSLTFDEVIRIHKGEIITKDLKDRFNKSFNNLTIKTQTGVKLQINNNRDKLLLDNNYIPLTINKSEFTNSNSKIVNNILKRYSRLNKKF